MLFLNGDLDEEVYMEIPQDLIQQGSLQLVTAWGRSADLGHEHHMDWSKLQGNRISSLQIVLFHMVLYNQGQITDCLQRRQRIILLLYWYMWMTLPLQATVLLLFKSWNRLFILPSNSRIKVSSDISLFWKCKIKCWNCYVTKKICLRAIGECRITCSKTC